jgi:hypothetical protein
MTLHTNDARALFLTGRLYFHPLEIVKDPNLTRKRKRALLADWASDRNAVESKPTLRRNPVTGVQCSLAEIAAALRLLDDDGTPPPAGSGVRAPPGVEGFCTLFLIGIELFPCGTAHKSSPGAYSQSFRSSSPGRGSPRSSAVAAERDPVIHNEL